MEAIINKLPEDINYMFYIKPKGAKRFSTYNPGKGTMGTGLVFTELYRKEHLLAVCKWIAEDNSGEWVYQLRSGDGKKIYWEHDSMPATPSETPQISMETAETVNVSAEGEKEAERAGNKPERKIKYFHYTPEQLKRYIIDVYEKYANGEWVLQPHKQIDTDKCFWNVINGKIGEWDREQEKFIEANMDFNSPTCGRCFKINRTYQQDYFIVSNEKLLEFTINGNYYYIQKQTYSKGKRRWCYTIMDAYGDFAVDDFSYTKRGIMQRFNKWWKKNATIIWQSPEFAPQSSESPLAGECTAEPCKLAQTA